MHSPQYRAPTRRRRAGEPLWAFLLIVAGWITLRVLLWEPPVLIPVEPDTSGLFATVSEAGEVRKPVASDIVRPAVEVAATPFLEITHGPRTVAPVRQTLVAPHDLLAVPFAIASVAEGQPDAGDVASPAERPAPSLGLMPSAKTRGPWSGDAWLLLRGGQRTVRRAGAPAGVLGDDQIGAVLRYRIAQAGGRNIALHARASKALTENGEAELAIGLQARPLPSIPVVAHVEGRLALREDETELRPAAYVTTGFDEVALPLRVKARGYGQAGYVGGAFATPFADGHVVASREVASFDLAPSVAGKVAVGAGAWGGAQEGAARIDVGPEASVTLQIADVPLRIAASYRLRVGGDAMPAHGTAITISTGF